MTAAPTETAIATRPKDTDVAVQAEHELATPRDPYDGIASAPFPEKAQAILAATLPDEDIEIRPDDGMLYLPGVRYRMRLNEAFGLGGWGLRPKGEPKVNGNQVFYTAQLYCLGRFVAEAMGEGKWISNNAKSSYGTALESAKTDALTRCCKDIGIASQLWDPSFTRRWKRDWAVYIQNPDRSRFGGANSVWVRKDDPCYAERGRSRDDVEQPVDPQYRATVGGTAAAPKEQAGSSTTRPSAAVGTPPTTQATTTPTKPNDSGASAIKHDGVFLSPAQLKKIQALRKEIGSQFSGPDEHPDSPWRKVLKVYRDQAGERITSLTNFSKEQASHLIQRMENKRARQGEVTASMDAQAAENVAAIGGATSVDLLEALHGHFSTATDENEWLSTFGWTDADAIPQESRRMALEMVLARATGGDQYEAVLKKARALGHIPEVR